MAEPEEVIIDAARHAASAIGRLWQRCSPHDAGYDALVDYKQRLEFLVAAVYGVPFKIRNAQSPAPPSALSRLFGRRARRPRETRSLPANDGIQIFLPREFPREHGNPVPLMRTLALQQAGRCLRAAAISFSPPADVLVSDLFQLSEAAAVDHALARDLPGITADLTAVRHAALRERPQLKRLGVSERAVEELYRHVLESHPARLPAPLVLGSRPGDSFAWAMRTAESILAQGTHYRGLVKDLWFGLVYATPPVKRLEKVMARPQETAREKRQTRTAKLVRRPNVREKQEDEDDQGPGMWMLQMDDPQEHVEDPMGLERPTDRDEEADPGGLADSLSELPEARLVSTPRPAPEVLLSDDPPDRRSALQAGATPSAAGMAYPEWDYRIGAYVSGTVVRIQPARLGDASWAEAVLSKRRALLTQVKRRFEGLRPRRVTQNRQPDGAEVDIGAYVSAFAEERAGQPLEDRLYLAIRPARRDIAIALLIDISGSTDAWVSHDLRIVDVEKEALVIVCHALDALGDPYTIQAFSGEGPANVTLWPVKDFDEHVNAAVHARIAALEPERYTRAGAALRHTAALLSGRESQHRLLILLSDGKPNDIDYYEGRYGVEDMRQAVAEATLQGIHPFCLTVDRHAPRYLPGVFGPGRYAVLQHPERLPVVLVDILRRLVRS
jgi:nitric oxide reductase NorD protein